jgi:predicted O-linked N-acetylglucosamine transferase (SPINDLY family)
MPTLSEALAIAAQHHQAGELRIAEQIYRQILAVEPNQADAWHLLGVVAAQEGRHDLAEMYIRRAIDLSGAEAAFYVNLGNVLQAQGKCDEAVGTFRRALTLKPDDAGALYNFGIVLKDQKKYDEAADCIRQAVKLAPDFADAHNNLGGVLQAQKKLDEAAICFRRALELKPDFAEAHNNLGATLKGRDRAEEAMACFRHALRLKPDYAEAWSNLGNAQQSQGQLDEAVTSCRRAIELKPDYAEAHSNLGNALHDQDKLDESIACYRRAIELKPDYAVAHYNLGNLFQEQGVHEDAVACYRKAIELNPDHAEAYSNLGTSLHCQCKWDEAIGAYRQALALRPGFAEARSNLLLALHYCDGTTLPELAVAHAVYERVHAARLQRTWQPHPNDRSAERPLRLGFVSADFGQHPVGFFLIRALENIDRSRFGIVCYSERKTEDELTERFRATVSLWRDVHEMRNAELAKQIRADRIDILFDLAGHTAKNRLLVFARKPAPIQVTWAGYAGTTGLAAMDYILADRYEIPPEAETYYSERALRLPDGYVCYDPPGYAPAVQPLPALERGFVTFGSFNNPAKITSQVVQVWSRILQRVPQSRLLLKYKGMDDIATVNRLASEFSDRGIDPARIQCLGWSPHESLLAEYNHIDIALDPFPYNGGLTTCEALWMGVPVVTCPGQTFASRHSLSHLSVVGLTETIAGDREEYVEVAVALAGDLARLATLRAGLRSRVAASPLCDGQRFAGNLMHALREAWRQWCQTEPGTHDAGRIERHRRSIASSSPLSMVEAAEKYAVALQHLQAGRLRPAETSFRELLAANPEHAEAWHQLGLIALQVGKPEIAVECISRAIVLNGNNPDFHVNLGNAYLARQNPEQAVDCYRRALELKPDHSPAYYNLSAAHRVLGKLEEAVDFYLHAQDPQPDYTVAHYHLGNALRAEGKLDEAVASFRWATKLNPEHAEAFNNLGNALFAQGKRDEAVTCLRRAMELKPTFVEAYSNLGNVLQAQGKLREAVDLYRRALALNPNIAQVHHNLGDALQALDEFDEAICCLQRALALKPDLAEAANSLGSAFHAQGKRSDALESFHTAIELRPAYPEAHRNLGLLLLQQGNFEQGWPEHEWRWNCKEFSAGALRRPTWDGSPVTGKILLHTDQGFGDIFQFIRYASLVKPRASQVVLLCPHRLIPLLSCCRGIDAFLPVVASTLEYEAEAHLTSLPAVFRTTIETTPRESSYLFAEPDLIEQWGHRLPTGEFKIGIAWQGNPEFRHDKSRSVPLANFAPLADISGVRLISLQKGHGVEQLERIKDQFPVAVLPPTLDESTGAFMDTAAVMMNLDLVITSDTAIAHLAGGLGVPVWVALSSNPEWRWLLDRNDSPWYPSMRLFRQTSGGDWRSVFQQVRSDLLELL